MSQWHHFTGITAGVMIFVLENFHSSSKSELCLGGD